MLTEVATSDVERDYHPVTCNLCAADDPEFRYQLDVSSIVTCRRCGLSYVNPRVSADWIEAKIEDWAIADTVDQERLRIAFDDATMRLYGRYLDWTERALENRPPSPTLLDIGCSVGAFLARANSEGYNVKGLEIGKASARYARNELGLDVSRGSIYDAEYSPGELDVVAMLEVIEHLPDPCGAVRKLSTWLKPGGALLLTTPNFDSLYRRLHGSRWWVIDCEDEHIYFFTIESLSQLLEDQGFEIRYVATRGFDIPGMLLQLLKHRKREHGSSAQEQTLDYYETRSNKERIKAALKRVGILRLVRGLLRGLDWLASQRWSPLYGLGEQMILIAVRPNGNRTPVQ